MIREDTMELDEPGEAALQVLRAQFCRSAPTDGSAP